MRLTALCLGPALLVSACSGNGDAAGDASVDAAEQSVPCALAGAESFETRCGVERSTVDGRTVLTLRHPNGGFRRLIELDGGKGYAAADGHEPLAIEANGAEIEVTLGDDHYLMPGPAAGDAAKR